MYPHDIEQPAHSFDLCLFHIPIPSGGVIQSTDSRALKRAVIFGNVKLVHINDPPNCLQVLLIQQPAYFQAAILQSYHQAEMLHLPAPRYCAGCNAA